MAQKSSKTTLKLPRKMTEREEADFWAKQKPDFESGWEEVKYVPRQTVAPREHVYRIRLGDDEMAALQSLAKRKRVPISTVLRELIWNALKTKTPA
jgi:hypothetical protein